ncbi:unnamed protein product, partial [Polarella glacialis]
GIFGRAAQALPFGPWTSPGLHAPCMSHGRQTTTGGGLSFRPPVPELRKLLSLGHGFRTEDVYQALAADLIRWRGSPNLATVVLRGLARAKLAQLALEVLKVMRNEGVE